MQNEVCTECHTEKSLSDFYRTGKMDKYDNRYKECVDELLPVVKAKTCTCCKETKTASEFSTLFSREIKGF